MYLQFNKFFAPDPPSGAIEDNKTDTFELLGDAEEPVETLELPKTPPKKDKDEKETDDEEEDGKEKEEEEDDELKALEEELEEPKDEDLEESTIFVPRREVLKKYPNLFKDFPHLDKAVYRERQFSELLPTVQDAKIAVEKSKVLDRVERDVMSGNITNVLHAAKQESEEAFLKIADNYLPALKAVDQQAYYHVMGNVIKDTIITMVREGKAMGEQGSPLQAAANILNQFVFGSQNFTPATPLSRQPRPEEMQQQNQLAQERQQQVMGRFESTREDLQTRADNVLKATILRDLDPRNSMTEYVKNHATQEAFNTLESLIQKDTRFRTILDKLWEKAFEKNFDRESTDKIKSAYLSKAKTLLPSVIKRARNDALKGMGRRVSEEREEESETEVEDKPVKSGVTPSGRSTSQPSGKIRKPSDIPKGMSTLDVLMKD